LENHRVTESIKKEVEAIISDLSLEEKVYMMSGHGFYEQFFGDDNLKFGLRAYQAGGGNERLNIEPLKFTDGPRGVRLGENTTSFPVAMARGASWDTELEHRIGEVLGVESRALGVSLSGAVCINILRHPAWGRAQETYGEDSHHLGEMGSALSEGIQTHNVMATVKHFAANNIENCRFTVDVQMNNRVLHEVYLPHFKRVIDSGCATVMSAYNKVNGHYCAHSEYLLRDVLKQDWGFKGFIHSDWCKGVHGADAATAGLDIENPGAIFFGSNLVKAVEKGDVDEDHIDEAVYRILSTQFSFQRAEDPRTYSLKDVACKDHTAIAREAAEKSFVLLKNDDALPLDTSKIKKLAVIGKLADEANLGDHGSSNCTPLYVVTMLEGIKAYAGDTLEITYTDGLDIPEAKLAAESADTVLIVAGYTYENEGEFIPGNEAMEGLDSDKKMETFGGDRDALTLLPDDETLINAIAEVNNKTIVTIMAGSAVIMENWRDKVAAIMMIWYPGMEGGNALARVLFGDVSPSGKLPFTIPATLEQCPFFDKNAETIKYNLYHGYTHFNKKGLRAAFPFGFGLSYTSFSYGASELAQSKGIITIAVPVKNTGDVTGTEVAQLYVGFENSTIDRPARLLKGFKRIKLIPGEEQIITFTLTPADVAYYNGQKENWEIEEIQYSLYVGGSSLLEVKAATFEWSV